MGYSFDGCDTVALAREYGTPLYVISERMVRERLSEIRTTFLDRHGNTFALYASKALLTLDICRIVASEGMGLDVVSGGEIHTAHRAGFPMERVYFHGNNKSREELELAVSLGVGRIVVDNVHELDLLIGVATAHAGPRPRILFRITPGVAGHTHKYISTGQVDSKFGIPLDGDVLERAVRTALDSDAVELFGFHAHIGSQLHANDAFRQATGVLLDLVKQMEAIGLTTRELNLGGGYGVRYTTDDDPKPLRYFTDAMMEDVAHHCARLDIPVPRIVIEPGRWIVAEAGITLYTVGSIKEIPGVRTYVSVDGGMTDNPRPALYGARYAALVADRPDDPADSLVTVAGKCCESGDILIRDIGLQRPRPGDTLVVFTTGAYNHSMANTYNLLPRPAMVLTDGGAHRLSVRRETYDDLLAREVTLPGEVTC
ncbi:MAG: diaminopimelate decarboxylase [Spirochaetaceae bacterium]|nr:MAG: diaminopimelate decarboxylase [Spirochaetaceae bacterium]